ncbi:Transcriptional regulator [Fructobacillus tropaeoli]|uniref:helix-turn-helix domain-containing protein n=1 Tax=Fructobacillus tropaeoli TaxID=709323 RepID=UPI002D8C4560|nr:Transcriptional regulator [Fructobacillus tropaeoli]
MKKIGESIRLIRKQKKLTQSVVYTGIISRNFASRFENGVSGIETSKFFQILKRLNVSPNEFEYIHYKNNEYKFKKMLHDIDNASSTNNFSELKSIYKQYHLENSLDSQILASLAYVKLYVHGNNPLNMQLEPTYPLKIHLLESSEWSLVEFRAFVDGIFIFRLENFNLNLCMKRAVKAHLKYKNLVDSKVEIDQNMGSIILNYLQIQLTNRKYNFINNYLKLSHTFSNELTDFTAILTLQFSDLLFNLYFDDDFNHARTECYEFLRTLQKLKFSDFKIFQDIYNYHLSLSEDYHRKKYKKDFGKKLV